MLKGTRRQYHVKKEQRTLLPYPLRRFIMERDHYTCQVCGKKANQIDHITPWAITHDDSPENLRAICRPCNLARRRKRVDARPTLKDWEWNIRLELKKQQSPMVLI